MEEAERFQRRPPQPLVRPGWTTEQRRPGNRLGSAVYVTCDKCGRAHTRNDFYPMMLHEATCQGGANKVPNFEADDTPLTGVTPKPEMPTAEVADGPPSSDSESDSESASQMVPPSQGGWESSFGSTLDRDGGNTNVLARCVEKADAESPSQSSKQGESSECFDDLTLIDHFKRCQHKYKRSVWVGYDMMSTWQTVRHDESTLRNLCREKQPTSQNELKLLLMQELGGIDSLPVNHSITELIAETAEYFLPS